MHCQPAADFLIESGGISRFPYYKVTYDCEGPELELVDKEQGKRVQRFCLLEFAARRLALANDLDGAKAFVTRIPMECDVFEVYSSIALLQEVLPAGFLDRGFLDVLLQRGGLSLDNSSRPRNADFSELAGSIAHFPHP